MPYRTDSTAVEGISKRFWKKVNKNGPTSKNVTTPCWVWIAGTNNYGYGSFWTKEKTWQAHRLSLVLTGVNVKDDDHVCHHCDNTLCVNPDHLFLSNAQGNLDDMVRKSRCVSSLSVGKVRLIRSLYKTGKFSYRKLAKLFKVDHTTISGVIRYKHWKVV